MATQSATEGSERSRYVVLVDLVGSRDIDDRESFGSRLEDAINIINDSEGKHMSTPMTRMGGIDEFGCVLTRLEPLPGIVCSLLDRIHPTLARFGVSTGEIDIGYDHETVAEMDGPAFHRARTLLEDAESVGLYAGVDTGAPTDSLVSTALNAFVLAREPITERQIEVILAYEQSGTQTAAGDQLGIPQQAVSDALRRANYRQRRAIRDELTRAIATNYD
ncbi:MAG: SatD family protein [Haloplanus sp.]